MGYYLSVLQQGKRYELEGKTLEFIQKIDGLYYFHICKYDEWDFDFKPTPSVMVYKEKELQYIKRVQTCSPNGSLRKIGKDKVFARY